MNEPSRFQSEELHSLLSELGRCVQNAVTDSPEVNAVLDRIRAHGYEPSFLVETSVSAAAGETGEGGVEMSVGVHRSPEPSQAALAMTPLDKKFLRSLKISAE